MIASFEPEFTLGRRQPGPAGELDRPAPIRHSLCYSATGFHFAHDYAIDLARALQAQGLEVMQPPRARPRPARLPIRHAAALRAADNHVIYCETVRGVALRHGLWASLAPKPIPDQAGNGAHLHASLWDPNESAACLYDQPRTRNVFHDASDPYGLSKLAYHFIGGVLAHLPALTALTCGSVNSYRRLTPQSWAGAYTAYGMDNREAAIRICSPMRTNPEGSTNLELKASDSSANPYLALGAYIHARLMDPNKLDPGEAVQCDPATMTKAERLRAGVHRRPESLSAALDALEADKYLIGALGSLRGRAYLAVKRAEAEAFAEKTIDYECFHYFTKI